MCKGSSGKVAHVCRLQSHPGVHLRELVSEVLQTVSAGAGPTALAAQKSHEKNSNE